jgi:hypothetical protein
MKEIFGLFLIVSVIAFVMLMASACALTLMATI